MLSILICSTAGLPLVGDHPRTADLPRNCPHAWSTFLTGSTTRFSRRCSLWSGDGEHRSWDPEKAGELLHNCLEVPNRLFLDLRPFYCPWGSASPTSSLGPQTLKVYPGSTLPSSATCTSLWMLKRHLHPRAAIFASFCMRVGRQTTKLAQSLVIMIGRCDVRAGMDCIYMFE